MGFSLEEQETVIRFDETGEPAEVYTSSPRVARILIRRGLSPYKTDTCKGEESGWYFQMPKHAVILKPGKTAIRVGGRISEKQRGGQ